MEYDKVDVYISGEDNEKHSFNNLGGHEREEHIYETLEDSRFIKFHDDNSFCIFPVALIKAISIHPLKEIEKK